MPVGGDMTKPKYSLALTIVLVIAIALSGCASSDQGLGGQNKFDDFGIEIGEMFNPLATALGELQSPAISEPFTRNGTYYQYTHGYLMVYNPNAPIGQQYRIYPLGRELGFEQTPSVPAIGDDLVVDGYAIWQELVPIYKMYGAVLVGPPLTDLLYNKKEQRYEQYFANMAFYQYVDRPGGGISLMPYGVWYCKDRCDQDAYFSIKDKFYPLPPSGRESYDSLNQATLAIDNYAQFLGREMTGNPLAEVQTNSEGQYFKIYENLVMIIDPRDLSNVEFLDLPVEVGVTPDEPEPPSEKEDYVFYPTRAGRGFNIPKDVFDFISAHGGIKVSGPPIKRVYKLDNSGLGQCFEHFCLEYNPSGLPGARIRLLPLGRDYFQKISGQVPVTVDQTVTPQTMTVKVWERSPMLAPGQAQEIGVAVFEGNKPLSNLNFYVTIMFPDGRQLVNFLPPTGSNGITRILLDPIDLPKGTMVPYQVCVAGITEGPACLRESFLIWED